MRDLLILLVHLIATLARLMGPGGLRSVVAESLLVKQQLLILNRSRHRAPNLRASDRILAGVCALFMRPARVLRSAVVVCRNSAEDNPHAESELQPMIASVWGRRGPNSCTLLGGEPTPDAQPPYFERWKRLTAEEWRRSG